MKDEYYTIKNAAKFLGVSTVTLRNWDKQGKLVAYRHPMNNYRVYKKDQLDDLAKKFDQTPKPVKPKRNTPKKLVVKILD
ncbi:helix-turn-helix domain-containing protein [Patescibacteria group bacterium]